MRYLCKTDYVMVNHGMLNAFVEIGHTKTSYFIYHMVRYLSYWTMSRVYCIFLLGGNLLDHGKINRDDAPKLMVNYLGVDPKAVMKVFETTRRARARF